MVAIVRIIETITRSFGHIAAWIVVPLMGAMVWEVFSRYVLSSPTFWAFEIAYMLMGASLMLGIAYGTQTRSHVRVDFIYAGLSPRGKAVVDLVGFAMLMPVVCWMTLGLWDYLAYAYVNNEVSGESAWNPVVWPFRATFVIGFGLFALQIVAETIKSLYVLITGRPFDGEATDMHAGSL